MPAPAPSGQGVHPAAQACRRQLTQLKTLPGSDVEWGGVATTLTPLHALPRTKREERIRDRPLVCCKEEERYHKKKQENLLCHSYPMATDMHLGRRFLLRGAAAVGHRGSPRAPLAPPPSILLPGAVYAVWGRQECLACSMPGGFSRSALLTPLQRDNGTVPCSILAPLGSALLPLLQGITINLAGDLKFSPFCVPEAR